MSEQDVPPIAFNRLHALVDRGYQPELGRGSDVNAIWLKHPGQEPTLILYPRGYLIGPSSISLSDKRSPRRKFREVALEPEDDAGFWRFIATVREPTLWESTAEWRAWLIAYSILYGVPLLLIWLALWLFQILFN